MGIIKLAPHVKSVRGRAGNLIFYEVKGRHLCRSYAVPRNPRTEKQQVNRARFGEISALWKNLSIAQKEVYERMACGRNMSGFNIFVSLKMRGIDPDLLKQVKASALYAPFSISINSVFTPAKCFNEQFRVDCGCLTVKKPPGNLAGAA